MNDNENSFFGEPGGAGKIIRKNNIGQTIWGSLTEIERKKENYQNELVEELMVSLIQDRNLSHLPVGMIRHLAKSVINLGYRRPR